jgi:hypothetical protein
MKKAILIMCVLMGMGGFGRAIAQSSSVVYLYDVNNQVLGTPSGASRIEFADGNLVVRNAAGETLGSYALASVDYFALADNGIHNVTDALGRVTASNVRVLDEGDALAVSAESGITHVSAYTVDGKLVGQQAAAAANECRLRLAVKGTIILRVETTDGVTMVKLIKK